MHPAVSVILFTTLSGAGYGALAWLGIALAMGSAAAPARPAAVAIVVALVLAAAGLVASLAHLGRPERAWRAFSQWRSSWLSREGVSATACMLPAAALVVMLWRGVESEAIRALGVATGLLALTTVFCTARIYTSLKPIEGWHNAWVLPTYFAFSLWSGLLLLWAFAAANGVPFARDALLVAVILAVALAALKFGYWRSIDAPSDLDAGHATGLSALGTVRAFEAPHTEANYLLKEMGYRVARRHSARLRVIVLVALMAASAVVVLAIFLVSWSAWLSIPTCVIAVLALAVERWLFFAQARHRVALYYGDRGR